MIVAEHLGLRLLNIVRLCGKTQAGVAKAVGITSTHMSRLVRSDTRLATARGDVLSALADELDTTIDYLVGRSDDAERK